MAGASATLLQTPPAAAHWPLSWQRLVLLVVLLNAPLFFNGCDNKETRFTAGLVIPFAEIVSNERQPWPVTISWWSWWRSAANLLVMGLGIWLSCRRLSWVARVATSRWTLATLVLVALVFDSWFYLPIVWFHGVFSPTFQVWAFLQGCFNSKEQPNEAVALYTLFASARLYYLACVAGVGGTTFGLQLFFRRYFFVQSGRWWQVQLGGLITVVLVSGTAIGIIARLLMQR